jgi:hypothetical protein
MIKSAQRFWNKLPETVKEQCLEIALQYPDKSPRESAWTIIDEHRYFTSESSVYRLLKQLPIRPHRDKILQGESSLASVYHPAVAHF